MVRLYGLFIKTYIKQLLEYRFSFFTSIILQIIDYASEFLLIWIIIRQVENINGWTFYELLFLYSMNLLSYALSGMFVKHPMLDFEKMVQMGDFDIALTKPMPTLFYVISRQYEYTFWGHVLLSVMTISFCADKINVKWDVIHILMFAAFMFGAVLIQAAFMIFGGCMSFFFVKSQMIVKTAIFGLRGFLTYPLSIYPLFVQAVMTFLLPYAFVNYYPCEVFLGKGDMMFPGVCMWSPAVGMVMIIGVIWLWNVGVRRYESVGN